MSSVLIVSMSPAGSTSPSTCTTSASAKPRTTCGDRVGLADVREELVAEPLPLARALHDAGDVDERHRRGHDPLAVEELGERVSRASGRFTTPTFGSIVANG